MSVRKALYDVLHQWPDRPCQITVSKETWEAYFQELVDDGIHDMTGMIVLKVCDTILVTPEHLADPDETA